MKPLLRGGRIPAVRPDEKSQLIPNKVARKYTSVKTHAGLAQEIVYAQGIFCIPEIAQSNVKIKK